MERRPKVRTLYLSGAMRNQHQWGFAAFDRAAKQLRRAGYNVINPAEMDRAIHIHEYTERVTPQHFRRFLRRDAAAIARSNGIAQIPGWERSEGSLVEQTLGQFLINGGVDFEIKSVEAWLEEAKH